MISKIIKSYTYVLQKKKSVFIFLITSFFLGFVLGLFFKRNTASFGYIVTKYYNVTFGLYSNPFKFGSSLFTSGKIRAQDIENLKTLNPI